MSLDPPTAGDAAAAAALEGRMRALGSYETEGVCRAREEVSLCGLVWGGGGWWWGGMVGVFVGVFAGAGLMGWCWVFWGVGLHVCIFQTSPHIETRRSPPQRGLIQ